MPPRIVHAESPTHIEHARALFREYATTIDAEACFHGIDKELASLPGAYAPPQGLLLLAYDDHDQPLGCVAVRPLAGATAHGLSAPTDNLHHAELKRLYLRPHARGQGLARTLTRRALTFARSRAYATIRLDTLPSMKEAIALYQSLGFSEITPPTPARFNERFFELSLTPALDITDASGALAPGALRRLNESATRVMAQLAARHDAHGSVRARIIRDPEMSALHATHSGDPTTTDVLTFDLREDSESPALDVDVLLCVDEADRQGALRNHPAEAELLLYLLHACLHCLGHNDDTPEASARMHAEEDAVLAAAGLPAIYSAPASP